jgi:hypothetical protein
MAGATEAMTHDQGIRCDDNPDVIRTGLVR